jgi:peroxiredoxin
MRNIKNIKMRNVLLFTLFLLTMTVSAQVIENPGSVNPLKTGEQMPGVSVKDLNNNEVLISEIIADGPAVFLFYRGGWCPYCTKHLSDIASVEDKIKEMGYKIIAISPDSPGKLKETLEKSTLSYKLYSDSNGTLIKGMGIAFNAPEGYEKLLSDHSDGINKGVLPVPSLYVVATDGSVKYRFLSPDYKLRISSKILLEELGKLQ